MYVVLPVVGVCLSLAVVLIVLVLLFCLWRNHKGQSVFEVYLLATALHLQSYSLVTVNTQFISFNFSYRIPPLKSKSALLVRVP